MTPATETSRRLAAPMVVLAGAGLAALLAWQSIAVNLDRGCAIQDTPYLDLCPPPGPGSPAPVDALRARIASNPGDANAYVALAAADRSERHPRLLQAAQLVAPNEARVVTLQAAAALAVNDWARAAGPLVQLVEYRNDPRAAAVLARLIGGGHGSLLAPYLTAGSQWIRLVLAQMPQAKAPFSTALPLVVQALKSGLLDAGTARVYIRQLKASGAWVDAYSLWLNLHNKPLSALYNGGFDDAFLPDGFDWEVAAAMPVSKAGAIVERRGAEQRGAVLDIRFTGRAMAAPLARQHLFLGPGRYRLHGEYMARQLRMEQGLAWSVRCTAAVSTAGRSDALGDTEGAWRAFAFEFTVPRECGPVASLQLETFAPYEAALGARGRVAFDAFSLEKLDL